MFARSSAFHGVPGGAATSVMGGALLLNKEEDEEEIEKEYFEGDGEEEVKVYV